MEKIGQNYLESIEMADELYKIANTENTYQFKSAKKR